MKNFKWFNGVKNVQELKVAYKNLVKKFHPDLNKEIDTTRQMQEINAEYDMLVMTLPISENDNKKVENEQDEIAFKAIIESLLRFDIEIEICGVWLWLGGNTYAIKESLKELGFKWSSDKKKWYWCAYVDQLKKRKPTKTMEQIRNTYGSKKLQGTKTTHVIQGTKKA